MNPQDERFDALMRERWQQAAAGLPGPLRLQLSPAIAARKHAATTTARRPRWWTGAVVAGTALAFWLGLGSHPAFSPQAPDETRIAIDPTDPITLPAAEDDEALLSRPPDFYAWLDSDEVRTLAME